MAPPLIPTWSETDFKKKGRRVNLQENELSRYHHKEACLDAITCGEAWVMIMHLEQLSLPQIRFSPSLRNLQHIS